MNQIMPDATERRAAALAEVNYMNDALIAAKETIGQLKADLHREEDRVIMMVEERDRYRHEALRLRKLLNELTTQMTNISLLARKAEEFVREVDEMDSAATPPTAEIDKMEKSAISQLQAAAQLRTEELSGESK
jgi:predicted RNase H-like nuclease (RuvC/YqgF family)